MSNILASSLAEEIKELLEYGFRAAWMMDLKIGDIFAGPRMFEFDPPRELYVVERIVRVGSGPIYDPTDEDDVRENYVMGLIVTDAQGLERHLAYGHSHEIYIWRP